MIKTSLLACILLPLAAFCQTGPGGVSSGAGTLRLWLDGKRVNADGSNPAVGADVTTWYDKSGNAVNVTQNTTGVADYSANGVTFNNVGYLAGSDAGFPSGNAARTVFICASSPSTNADDVFFFYGTASDNDSYGILKIMSSDGAAPNGVRNYFYNNDFNVAGGWTPSGTLKIITATYTNNTQSVYINNGAASTRTPTTPTTTLGGAQGLQIGGWSSFNLHSQATIGEVIFHNALLDAADIIIINNYLAAKFGLTLTANDLYDNDNVGNGNYDYDVAGIGQAAAAALNNDAQSGIVRINGPTGMGNGEYYIWGHDNATMDPTTAGIPSGVAARLTRIWRGSETGTITDMDVSFDLTGLGPVVAGTLRLLIDTDNDGSFADETTGGGGIITGATSLGSNVYQFANVTGINNDNRFTLGTANTTTTPLPVELIAFEAKSTSREIMLTWKTASETHNEYFEVQRSRTGEDWEDVSRVPGAGNSTSLRSYEATDALPHNGKSYYRLKQVDLDGTYEYSSVKAVVFRYDDALFPNPTTGVVTLTSGDDTIDLNGISVFSTFGNTVTDRVLMKQLSKNQFEIDLSPLPQGIYLVRTRRTSRLVHKQ